LLVAAVFALSGSNESCALGSRIESNSIIVAAAGMTAVAVRAIA
jgi:hypothetical protein